MAFKFIGLTLLISAATAEVIHVLQNQQNHQAQLSHNYAQPLAVHQPTLVKKIIQADAHDNYEHENYGPAHYQFDYSVHDDHTGDIKSQHEVREGDKVQGYYTLVEPDGHQRTVHYNADKHSGFNAQVERKYLGDQYVQQHNTYNAHNAHYTPQIHNAHSSQNAYHTSQLDNTHNTHSIQYTPQVHKIIAVAPQAHQVHQVQPAHTFSSLNSGHDNSHTNIDVRSGFQESSTLGSHGHQSINNYHH